MTNKTKKPTPKTPLSKRRISASLADNVFVVVRKYRESVRFQNLSIRTKEQYERDLMILLASTLSTHSIYKNDFEQIRTSIYRNHGAARANQFLASISAFLSWAVREDLANVNFLYYTEKYPLGEWQPWPQSVLEDMLVNAGPEPGLAVGLGYYTGQRLGDIARLEWGNWLNYHDLTICLAEHTEDTALIFHQHKTNNTMVIPVAKPLNALLRKYLAIESASPKPIHQKTPIFTEQSPGYIYRLVQAELKRRGHLRYPFHGLRKNCMNRLAECGCTDAEIMAVTGHKTRAMVTHYTKAAEQKKRAMAAIAKMGGRRECS